MIISPAALSTRAVIGFWAAALVAYVFLYAPIAAMVSLSFNDSLSIGLPWAGFTTKWYAASIQATAISAFLNSFKLAIAVSLVATLLGLGVALASRRVSRFQGVLMNALFLALLMPGIALAVGQSTFFKAIGLLPGLWTTTFIGHLTYTVPFAFLNIYPRLHKFDPNLEAAAADLGATPWTAFHTVLLPQIMPGIVASVLFCFTLSFDEFTRTLFLVGNENTLPTYLWSIILADPSPVTSAIATLSMLFSLGVIGAGLAMLSLRQRLSRKASI